MTITIRHAAPSDLASIQAISDAAYGVYVAAMGQKPGPMLADYGAHLADDAVLVAADSGGVLRGYAVMLDRPDGFWLENIAVDPAAQG
ncbi:MAG TPA: GNAT family N-acetyltransferase, partial [Alphaproteobacteria bacterium]|nr:GNAT family N-acetyltransferase [Alphaproteobacteria bacterium]